MLGLFQHFLNFLSNGFESSNIVIKQICAKHICNSMWFWFSLILNN